MKNSLKTLSGLCVVLLLISFSTNALCERLRGISNKEIKTPEYVSKSLNQDDYAHVFRDRYADEFYYNEKTPSGLSGYRLFIGKWEYNNIIYNTTLLYNTNTGYTAVCADFIDNKVFYYLLKPTSAEKYHKGSYTYLKFGTHTKRVRDMSFTWIKGGY